MNKYYLVQSKLGDEKKLNRNVKPIPYCTVQTSCAIPPLYQLTVFESTTGSRQPFLQFISPSGRFICVANFLQLVVSGNCCLQNDETLRHGLGRTGAWIFTSWGIHQAGACNSDRRTIGTLHKSRTFPTRRNQAPRNLRWTGPEPVSRKAKPPGHPFTWERNDYTILFFTTYLAFLYQFRDLT